MPHDRFGRTINLGDTVIAKPYNQGKNTPREYVGVVVEMEESQSCTGQIVYQSPYEGNKTDYFGAEDSELVLYANGERPVPKEPVNKF